jgi:predicted nucleotidyltransferase
MPPDPDRVAAAQRALANVVEEWMERPGVVSVEVARLWLTGGPTDEAQQATSDVAIRVTVERKRPLADVPEAERFPRQLDGVRVQVTEGRAPRPEPGGE